MKYIILFSLVVLMISAQAQSTNGMWKGFIEYQQIDVSFAFEIEQGQGKVIVTFINGEERLVCKDSEIINDSIFVKISPFDVTLTGRIDGETISGVWKKGYRKKGVSFRAIKGKPRFTLGPEKKSLPNSNWDLTLESSGTASNGVGLFNVINGIATGTILTSTGDYRFMEGVYRNDSLLLTSFDGAHGFYLQAKVSGNSITGILHMDNDYTENVTGTFNLEAALSDPFKSIEGGQRPYFDILSAGDAQIKIDADKYFDKVLIIQLFGTWCPNSMDQSNFLRGWYKTKPADVEVLAVTFEPNFTTEYGNERISDYQKSMSLPYDINLGGKLSKGQAALALPHTNKINAFPTLILVDKAGFIRYEFDYFNGPATGILYQDFVRVFRERIAELVAE